MNEEKRTYISGQIEALQKDLEAAAHLTAALAESMADPIDCTLADLYDAEYIATTLRRTISAPAVMQAIRNLTANAILDADEMKAAGIIEPTPGPDTDTATEKASKEVNR